jgi:tellurite methyltransferase
VLHLLEAAARDSLIAAMRSCTVPGGWNVVACFTDELPPPADLAPFCLGLFRPGEIMDRYRDWDIELERAYVLEDEHPGGVRHRHPINKVVARRPV